MSASTPLSDTELSRRALLESAGALALTQLAPNAIASAPTSRAIPSGKPGDFAFLAGEWRMRNRRLKDASKNEWEEFDGEATVWSILNGVASIEELRIPARNFAGSGIRILNIKERVWNDYWVNAKDGVLGVPPSSGWFFDGVGNFDGEWKEGEVLMKSRGVWDRITPTTCRWHQLSSKDGGKTWEPNWFMDWTRVR